MTANITQDTDPGVNMAIVNWDQPNVTDNSGVATLTSSHQPGSKFDIGQTSLFVKAVDPSGNNLTEYFNVTVKGKY